jgi:hypothetical protein
LQKFSSFFADDVEFYHDKAGVTLGKEALTEAVKKNICGKVTREIDPGAPESSGSRREDVQIEVDNPPVFRETLKICLTH